MATCTEQENYETVQVNNIGTDRKTRVSSLRFNVADVARPLASAVKFVEAGNRIVMDPEAESYIENIGTGERMKIRAERGTYVFDADFVDGTNGTITLDSGAGVNVLPKSMFQDEPMLPKQENLKMVAANGTVIQNFGQKVIRFRGDAVRTESAGFARQA